MSSNIQQIKKKLAEGKITKPEFIEKMHDLYSNNLFPYVQAMGDTDIKEIQLTDSGIIMTTKRAGIKFRCDLDDQRIIPIEILNFGDYENEEIETVKSLLDLSGKDDPVIFDIGANIGWYSLNIANNFRKAKIFAFEPIPKTYSYLVENISLNNVSNVQAFNHGLSSEEKNITFYYYKEGSGNASLADLSGKSSAEEIKSSVRVMDTVVKELDVKVDFIKCDVEGAELLVFKGGLKTLKDHKPIVFTEMLRKWSEKFNYHPNDIIELFAEIDYSCFVIQRKKLVMFDKVDENTKETNYIFIHKDVIDTFV